MAQIHPSASAGGALGAGDYAELEVLRALESGLPDGFDIFHGVPWSAMHEGLQRFGEYDVVVVSPAGQMLILEVKSGPLDESGGHLAKAYGRHTKDIEHQARRLHSSLLRRMQAGELPQAHVGLLLVLPEYRLKGHLVAYPPERIVDAQRIGELCSIVRTSFPAQGMDQADRQRLLDFFSNRFDVVPDVATRVGQVQAATRRLASGLATWMPRIRHPDEVYVVEATAGSGKTQLALALLNDAARQGQRARYVCFNRPLADHLGHLAPTRCEVSTFHQLCRDHAEHAGVPIDFSQPGVFERLAGLYMEAAKGEAPFLDLLVLDESQDLHPAWVEALAGALVAGGRLYVMGDSQQQLYEREPFELPGAVTVRCMDNFRSPVQVVNLMNRLRLTSSPVLAQSALAGQFPEFDVYGDGEASASAQLDRAIRRLLDAGFAPQQIAVVTFRGVQQSDVLKQDRIAGLATRRFTGRYDAAGNALWSEGELLVESVYRFKGQSAAAVILCEIDFDAFEDREKRKLFVGLTRGQLRVDLVLSARAAAALMSALDKD